MKIGFFDIEGWEEPIVRERFKAHDLWFTHEKLSSSSIPARTDFDIVSVFVDSSVGADVVAKFPNLKLVTTRSTGFDHLDIGALKIGGAAAAYVPGYGDNTVAEYAFGLILCLTRKLYATIDHVKHTDSFSFEGFRGMDLKGKTLGVIGTGRIGRETIKIARGFGMNVMAYDPFPNADAAVALGYVYAPLADTLANADVITIHAPLNEQTRHLINRKNIGLAKRGSYLVNTARGPIVETGALLEAIMDGTLAGAALDVLEDEGDVKDEMSFLRGAGAEQAHKMRVLLENHALMHLPNVLVTPHNAFNTREALERILNTTMENIDAFLEGKPKNIAG